jgi:hypothetical protein
MTGVGVRRDKAIATVNARSLFELEPHFAAIGRGEPHLVAPALALRTEDSEAFAIALGFRPVAHHRLMLDLVRRVYEGEVDALLIDSPPGSAKSTYVTLIGSCYMLARDPRLRIICGFNSERLAEHWGRQIRNHIDGTELRDLARYSGEIGEFHLDISEDQHAAARFSIDAGGSWLGVSHGANLIGNRCDILMLDDVVESFEVAFSESQLAKIATWLKTDAISRLDGRVRLISVMQRMAANDPHGVLGRHLAAIPGLKVEHITLRMEAEGDDPLGRSPDAPLWPNHYTPQAIALAKRDAVSWQTRYQQRPVLSTGEWCRREWIVLDSTPPPSSESRVYIASDFATARCAVTSRCMP